VIAAAAAHGTPWANVLVPFAGILAFVGGLSVAVGYHARWGAVALILFLVPVTLVMHRFWGLDDPQQAQMQMINFLKNVALIGGAALIVVHGAGAVSLDARAHRTLELHHG
jgi:putative oxidoreductase